MKARRLLKTIGSLSVEMVEMDAAYGSEHRDEIRAILAEFLEDIFQHGGVYEIQQRVAATQKIDVEAVQSILDILAAANPQNFTLSFSTGTSREVDIQKELRDLNEALKKIREGQTKLGLTSILLKLEYYFDSRISEILMAFGLNHTVFEKIKEVLRPKFSLVSNDDVLLFWARLKAQFEGDDRRSSFKFYEDIMGEDYWQERGVESIREKILDFIVRLKSITIKRMIADGETMHPVGMVGIARTAGGTGVGMTNNMDLLVVRSISHVVAFYEFLTFSEAADLAKSIGQESDSLIFGGADFSDYLRELSKLRGNNFKNFMKLLYEKMLRLIEYVEEVAITKTTMSEALWHYKLGQEVIAPFRMNDIKSGRLNEIALQKELSKFLIERGILSYGVVLGRNEVDLYSKEMGGEDFVIETKVYKKSPSETQIVNNLVQLQSYMDQHVQPRGVLVIYNCSDDLILSPKKWHKGRFWILSINIGNATPSKRSRSIEIKESVENNKLIYCVSSGETKKGKAANKKKVVKKKATKNKN